VEQPVSVGLTQGTPDIYDEVGLGHEFLGFFKNFVDDFELQGSDIYLTGESYGGFYIPHIGNAMILANDTCHYNFKGAYIIDPLIG
jgi:carboxypeptidase D